MLNMSGSEEALERHLDSVLWYNGDQVRAALQTTLKSTLKGFQKRQKVRFDFIEL